MGMYSELGYQMKEVRLTAGDKIIMLTDGVYARLKEEELKYHLSKTAPDAQERVNSLLKLSNTRGNLDNQTAMILEF
jgi:serine/threonine protein phosphatase PrpC